MTLLNTNAQWVHLAKARNFAKYALVMDHAPNRLFSSKMSHKCALSTNLSKVETFKAWKFNNIYDCPNP